MGINGLPATSTSPAAEASFAPRAPVRRSGLPERMQQFQRSVVGVGNAPESPGTPDKSLAGFESLDLKTSPDVTSRFTQSTVASGKADAPTPSDSPKKQNEASPGKRCVHFAQGEKLVTVKERILWYPDEDSGITPEPEPTAVLMGVPAEPVLERDSTRFEIHGNSAVFRLVKRTKLQRLWHAFKYKSHRTSMKLAVHARPRWVSGLACTK